MDIPAIATVEISSEDPQFPIDNVFQNEEGPGWRAGGAGKQTLRLSFETARTIRHIRLEFRETERERTQEFTLRWWAKGDSMPREIIRQQWNFSPRGSTREVEDYGVNLDHVSALELQINPEIGGGDVRASLQRWQIA